MHGNVISLLLPFLFIVHNLEELRGYSVFETYCLKHLWKGLKNRAVFRGALIFLSSVVFIVVGANYFIDAPLLEKLSRIILFAILLNAVYHVGVSLYYRRLLPGVITSLFLLMPYGIIMLSSQSMRRAFTMTMLLIAILAMTASAYLGFFIGYLYTKIRRKK